MSIDELSKLDYELIEPQPYSSEAPLDDTTLIVSANELGARLDDYHGARCQVLARLGAPVLAYDRPLSLLPVRSALGARAFAGKHIEYVFAKTAEQLQKQIETIGPKRVIMAGHSGGGYGVTGVTASGEVGTDHLIITDTAGMYEYSQLAGLGMYLRHRVLVEPFRPASERQKNSYHVENPRLPTTTLGRVAKELWTYGAEAHSKGNRDRLEVIRDTMPGVAVDAIIPEHSVTVPHFAVESVALRLMREGDPNRPEPFRVTVLRGKYHSYFDDYGIFTGTVAAAISARDQWHADRSQ